MSRRKHHSMTSWPPEVITVRSDADGKLPQNLPFRPGISGKSAGARGISMYKIVIPPGASAEPHTHVKFETAIYLLKGRVETRYGARLEKSVVNVAGDFVFIPPNLPHQPVNLSATETAEAIVARNDPSETESVLPYKPDL